MTDFSLSGLPWQGRVTDAEVDSAAAAQVLAAVAGDAAMSRLEDVLVSLRRIIRVTDIHAKRLARETGLTASQLLILQTIRQAGELTIGGIAREVNLTQATITSIVDRMERAGLVARERSTSDKRKVFVTLTSRGEEAIGRAPTVLQDRFAIRFEQLPDWEQSLVLAALQRVATLMDAEELDAAPVLDVGRIDRDSRELES